jgi:hypothetical protein
MIYKGTDIDFQPGDVILFRYGFIWHELERYLSAINRAFTGSYYNHGGIVVKSNDMLLINESVGKGVISRPLLLNLEREKTKLIVLRSRVKQGIDEVCKKRSSSRARHTITAPLFFINLCTGSLKNGSDLRGKEQKRPWAALNTWPGVTRAPSGICTPLLK